jgi:hypothetical protein
LLLDDRIGGASDTLFINKLVTYYFFHLPQKNNPTETIQAPIVRQKKREKKNPTCSATAQTNHPIE